MSPHVQVTSCTCNMVPGKGWVLMVSEAEALSAGTPVSSGPADASAAVHINTPAAKIKAEPPFMMTPGSL